MARYSPEGFALLLGLAGTVLGLSLAFSVLKTLRRRQLSREATTEVEGRVIDVVFRVNHQPTLPARRHAVIAVILPDGTKKTFEDRVELADGAVAFGTTIPCRYDPVSGHLQASRIERERQPDAFPLPWRVFGAFAFFVGGVVLTIYVIRRYGL